ncbi:MAG: methyltransferase [Treponema sp.]|nr:methyltransferase [Treponema sp.]
MAETPRERVLKTINHVEPEVPAIDFGSTTSSGISIFEYIDLKEYLGINQTELPVLFDIFLMLADPCASMIERFGGDIIQLKRLAPNFGIKLCDWKQWTLHNGKTVLVPGGFNPKPDAEGGLVIENAQGIAVARMPSKGYYFDLIHFPYKNIEEADEIDKLELCGVLDEEINYLSKEGKRLFEETDKAVVFSFGGRLVEAGLFGWGFEEFLVNLLANPDMIHRYFERLTDIYINDIDRILQQCNNYIDIFRFVDDLGTQNSLLMSPAVYREMVKPYHKKMFQFIKKKYPKQKIATHCCGAIYPVIPDLIDAGIDIINPVQISASGMDPLQLKKEFGKDIVFWGGAANMQATVPYGTLDEIKKETGTLTEIFMKDGGFIFNPVHNIQANIAPEKIAAIYDVALRYR